MEVAAFCRRVVFPGELKWRKSPHNARGAFVRIFCLVANLSLVRIRRKCRIRVQFVCKTNRRLNCSLFIW